MENNQREIRILEERKEILEEQLAQMEPILAAQEEYHATTSKTLIRELETQQIALNSENRQLNKAKTKRKKLDIKKKKVPGRTLAISLIFAVTGLAVGGIPGALVGAVLSWIAAPAVLSILSEVKFKIGSFFKKKNPEVLSGAVKETKKEINENGMELKNSKKTVDSYRRRVVMLKAELTQVNEDIRARQERERVAINAVIQLPDNISYPQQQQEPQNRR